MVLTDSRGSRALTVAGTLLKGLTAWCVLVLGVLAALTLIRLAGAPVSNSGPVAAGGGTAVVTGCQRQGPVSSGGLGYFWECDGTVKTRSGSQFPTEFRADELSPADGANPVGVNKVGKEWLRNVDHSYGLLKVAGIVVLLFVIPCLFISRDTLRCWLLFRSRARELETTTRSNASGAHVSVYFPMPKPQDGQLMFVLFLAVVGVASLITGFMMTLAQHRLGQSGLWGYAVTVPFIPFGAGVLAFVPYLYRTVRTSTTSYYTMVDITAEGIRQPMSDKKTMLLPWDDLRAVVFEEDTLGGLVAVHLALVGEEAVQNLVVVYRQPSRYGVLLSPTMRFDQASIAAKAIEARRPGLVRWPAREIERGGFGIAKAVKRVVVRWKHRGVEETVETAVSPTVPAGLPSMARMAAISVLLPLIVGYFVLRMVSPGMAPAWFVVIAVYGVALFLTRYRGRDGEFTADDSALTWWPDKDQPWTVRRAEIGRLVSEPVATERGRRYMALRVVRPDDTQFVLASRISTAAANRVVMANEALTPKK